MTPEQKARGLLPPANIMHHCELWLDGQYYQFINQDGAWIEAPEFDIDIERDIELDIEREAAQHPDMIDGLQLSGFLDMERGHYVPIYLRPDSDVTAIGGIPIVANTSAPKGKHKGGRPKAKISTAAVMKMRKRKMPWKSIAQEFGVSESTVKRIIS